MSEAPNRPLKELLNRQVINTIAERLSATDPEFPSESFAKAARRGLSRLEFKDRVRHLARTLREHLHPEYPRALGHIVRSLGPPAVDPESVGVSLEYWVFCQFVEDFGVEYPDASLPALRELTQRFSAEFAIRPFLVRYAERTLALLVDWTFDPSPQVRRLASEGSRPRLPWGPRLKALHQDPYCTRPILDHLVDDSSLMVRRSVANHLNDISKDSPEVALEIAAGWLKHPTPEREWAVRHALRTLIKKGDPRVMALLGFQRPKVRLERFTVLPERLRTGESAQIDVEMLSTGRSAQKLLIDYAVHFSKSNGTLTPKVFKWKQTELAAGASLTLAKRQSFAEYSTRRIYPGEHAVEILINGQSMGRRTLQVDP